MNRRTALYIRVSTSKSSQKTDSQHHELRRYCKARGWNNVEVYEDRVSGAKTSRPQLDLMQQDMRNGKVERVVCYKLDRCGRSLTHLCLLLDEMNKLGVPLICTSQGIDTSSDNPAAKLQLDILKAVCEFEKNLIKDRVNAGLAAARSRGVKLGRPSTLKERKAEVETLRSEGKGIREIADELHMPVSSVFKLVKQSEAQ